MAMLASDLMNPAFVGARNPDELLAVEFYWGVIKDMRGRPALDKEGNAKKIPFIRISVPGNDTSMVDTAVRPEHKIRFKRQWDFWQAQEIEGAEQIVDGWRLEDWPELTDEQRRDLKYLRFSVVEQLAQASDSQCQRFGADGMSLRIKARKALTARAEEIANREREAKQREIDQLKAAMAAMQEQMAKLTDAKETIVSSANPTEPPKRRGRPPKVKEVV